MCRLPPLLLRSHSPHKPDTTEQLRILAAPHCHSCGRCSTIPVTPLLPPLAPMHARTLTTWGCRCAGAARQQPHLQVNAIVELLFMPCIPLCTCSIRWFLTFFQNFWSRIFLPLSHPSANERCVLANAGGRVLLRFQSLIPMDLRSGC